MFPVAEEARFWVKSFEKESKARLREDDEDIGSVGFVIGFVEKTDHTYGAGIGNGNIYPM